MVNVFVATTSHSYSQLQISSSHSTQDYDLAFSYCKWLYHGVMLWYPINESKYLGRLDFYWCFQLALLLGVFGTFFICLFSHWVHTSIYSPPHSRSPLPLYVRRVVFKNHLPKYIISLSSPSPFALLCMLRLPMLLTGSNTLCVPTLL